MSLCHNCCHCQLVVSGRGSTFYLCRLSQTESQYPKYPPQPVIRCAGYVAKPEEPARDG
ncbi:hypothetical protein [Anatilimnocola floriformis]|uniref:hypothetical protein n=1 Tax=Anatilimnocola floriformis TaxID=2948575 RepID=UPI0020C20E76|nr:hypothetical protein [Anatilimnocola floriformis]